MRSLALRDPELADHLELRRVRLHEADRAPTLIIDIKHAVGRDDRALALATAPIRVILRRAGRPIDGYPVALVVVDPVGAVD